jgi:hypothetical protein
LLWFLAWQIWQQRWHQAHRREVLMPPQVYDKLQGDIREALSQEGKTEVRLSAGNVIFAWSLNERTASTIYSSEPSSNRLVGLSNLNSLRIFSDDLNQYAQNCVIPLPYPIFTDAWIKYQPLHHLSYELAKATSEISLGHAMQVCKLLEEINKAITDY